MEAAAPYAGAVGEIAAAHKPTKYVALDSCEPIAVESLLPFNNSATTFFGVLGRRIPEISGDSHESSFLLHWFNAVLLHDSFVDEEAGVGIPA